MQGAMQRPNPDIVFQSQTVYQLWLYVLILNLPITQVENMQSKDTYADKSVQIFQSRPCSRSLVYDALSQTASEVLNILC